MMHIDRITDTDAQAINGTAPDVGPRHKDAPMSASPAQKPYGLQTNCLKALPASLWRSRHRQRPVSRAKRMLTFQERLAATGRNQKSP